MTVLQLLLIVCAREKGRNERYIGNREEIKLHEESGRVPQDGTVILASNC